MCAHARAIKTRRLTTTSHTLRFRWHIIRTLGVCVCVLLLLLLLLLSVFCLLFFFFFFFKQITDRKNKKQSRNNFVMNNTHIMNILY